MPNPFTKKVRLIAAFLTLFLFSAGFVKGQTTATLTLKVFIEGLYLGLGTMSSPLYNSGLVGNPQHADSIEVQLAKSNAPYIVFYTTRALLYSNGTAAMYLPGSFIGQSCYIIVKHRFGIEVWSKTPVVFNAVTFFDFSRQEYCKPGPASGSCFLDEWISGVEFGTISNTGQTCALGAPAFGYQDFSSLRTNLQPGSLNNNLSVTISTFYIGDSLKAWFDWNQNGQLNDPGEEYTFGTLAGTTLGTFTFHTNIAVPATANEGSTRMRIRLYWNALVGPCGNSNYGETEDYTVNVVRTPTVVTDAVNTISAYNAFSGGQITDDGGLPVVSRGVIWSTAPNPAITLSSKTENGIGMGSFSSFACGLNPGTTYYLRAYADNGAYVGYGNELTFTTLPICTPDPSAGTCLNDEWISNVQFGAISNSAQTCALGAPAFGYQDFSTLRTYVGLGSPLNNLAVTITNFYLGDTLKAWFDWNQNGQFTDPGEEYSFGALTGSPLGTFTFHTNIAVPATANEGSTRMRIRLFWNALVGPCGNSIYGETEDYTVFVDSRPVDICGNAYDTIVIGNQVWFKQNLTVAKYRNGDSIPTGLSNLEWTTASTGAYDSYFGNVYGKLYNFHAVEDPRGLCPASWHVPSVAEWQTLLSNLSGQSGPALKAVSPTWQPYPDWLPTNSSGFSALPAGMRMYNGWIFNESRNAYFWTSDATSSISAIYYDVPYDGEYVTNLDYFKRNGNSVRCVRNNVPSLTTAPVTGIGNTFAATGGTISDARGDSVTARGVVWSTSPNPTIVLPTKTSDGVGAGGFLSNITGLVQGATYYVRAYATNAVGTAYGNEISFTTLNSPTDIDGNTYDTVVIGTQVWMSNNLRVSKYRNGDSIPTNLSDTAWASTTSGAFAIYNNTAANDTIYGKLYNWYAVADPRGLCPAGWHVPSFADWAILENSLGGSSVAGGKMKAVSPLWTAPNTGATNSSGFSGLPGGFRVPSGQYGLLGLIGWWWSSTPSSATDAWIRATNGVDATLGYTNGAKVGVSVRCVRD